MATDKSVASPNDKSVASPNDPAHEIETHDWDVIGANVDGFYAPEVSGRLVGRVLEDFDMETQFGNQTCVKVKTAIPMKAYVKQEVVELPIGSVVAVRISIGLAPLLDCVQNQCAIEIQPAGKTKTKRGSMWTYRIRSKGTRIKRAIRPQVRDTDGDERGEDLPF